MQTVIALFLTAVVLGLAMNELRKQTLRAARAALYRHDFDKALNYTRLALRLPLLLPIGRVFIGRFHAQLLVQTGRYDDALGQINSALAYIAKRPSAFWNQTALSLLNLKATCLDAVGERTEAEQCRRATLDVWASMGDREGAGTVEAAVAEQQRGEYGLAMERMRVAIERTDNEAERASRRLHLALMASEIGRFDQAVSEAEFALPHLSEPLQLIAFLGMTEWALNDGDLERSEQFLIQSLAHSEKVDLPRMSMQARLIQAELMFARGEQHEAIARLHSLLHADDCQWTVIGTLGERLYWMGLVQDAIDVLEHAYEAVGTAPNVTTDIRAAISVLAAKAYLEIGNLEKAQEWVAKALAQAAKRPRVVARMHATAAFIAIGRNSFIDAQAHMDAAEIALQPYQDAPIMRAYRGLIRARWSLLHSDYLTAENELLAAMEYVALRRDLPIYHYFLGECHRMEGDAERAAEAYRAAIAVGFEHLYACKSRERLKEFQSSSV